MNLRLAVGLFFCCVMGKSFCGTKESIRITNITSLPLIVQEWSKAPGKDTVCETVVDPGTCTLFVSSDCSSPVRDCNWMFDVCAGDGLKKHLKARYLFSCSAPGEYTICYSDVFLKERNKAKSSPNFNVKSFYREFSHTSKPLLLVKSTIKNGKEGTGTAAELVLTSEAQWDVKLLSSKLYLKNSKNF